MKLDLASKLLKKSQGRFDALKEVVESGTLQQPGLMQAVIDSLGDGDRLMVDYILKKVLPHYGRSAIPRLSQAFNPGGNLTDAHRLAAIRKFDILEAKKLARLALNAAHTDLSREAIRTLKGSKKDILPILEQIKRGNADIRREAFSALEGIAEKRVISEVSAAFTRGVAEASCAIRFTTHPAYAEVCTSMLTSLNKKIGTAAGLRKKEHLMLIAVFKACAGHGGDALDKALTIWVQRAAEGFLYSRQNLYGYGQVRSLLESVALSTTPQAQKFLVENRDKFHRSQMTAIMCAASWHKSFDLVELFAPYVPQFKNRCYGWFCECGGDWPCSVLSAVEFALDVKFEATSYEGRKPHPLQMSLINKIREDPRWKVARRT